MSLTSLVPLWLRWLVLAAAIGAVWTLGDMHGQEEEGEAKDLVIAKMQHEFDESIHTADVALAAANARAAAASLGATNDQAAITAAYQKGMKDAAVATNARLADYAAGRRRMRVDAVCVPADAGGGRAVPGAATAASGPDAAALAPAVELRPDAARRVAAAAAEVEALARQVVALQALAKSEHDRCNEASAPREPSPAEKRSIIKLGAKNPFD